MSSESDSRLEQREAISSVVPPPVVDAKSFMMLEAEVERSVERSEDAVRYCEAEDAPASGASVSAPVSDASVSKYTGADGEGSPGAPGVGSWCVSRISVRMALCTAKARSARGDSAVASRYARRASSSGTATSRAAARRGTGERERTRRRADASIALRRCARVGGFAGPAPMAGAAVAAGGAGGVFLAGRPRCRLFWGESERTPRSMERRAALLRGSFRRPRRAPAGGSATSAITGCTSRPWSQVDVGASADPLSII